MCVKGEDDVPMDGRMYGFEGLEDVFEDWADIESK